MSETSVNTVPESVVNTVRVNSEPQKVVFGEIGGFKNFRDNPLTVEEAIQKSGSDFTVKKEHIVRVADEDWDRFVKGDFSTVSLNGSNLIQTHCATVRTDNGRNLGIVGKDYGVVQNSTAFEFIDLIVNGMAGGDANKAVITSCGTLGGGAQMFVSAKMPTDMHIGDSDVEDYILFVNSHDGSYSVQVLFTPVRVICQNTLNLALSTAKNKFTFKHTSRVETRLDLQQQENMERAISVLKLHERFKEEFVARLSALATERVSEADVTKFAAMLYLTAPQMELVNKNNGSIEGVEEISSRTRNNINTLVNSIHNGVGQNVNEGTKFWLINGLTTFYANEKRWKSSDEKFTSIFGGSANRKLQTAFDYVQSL